ncbi:hypothetical protein BC937DRAFT_88975, partial [Endogone sp. FLAS-F59071]
MPLNVTKEEPGWIRLRADASDLLKDTQALKVYTAVHDLVATKDPKIIAMLCVAFLLALDGYKLAKFPDESRVWYVVAETQYTLAVTGLNEPADPPSEASSVNHTVDAIEEGLEVTDATSDAVSDRYKPGPKLCSLKSKEEAPSLPVKKRKAEKQTIGKDEKQWATGDNFVIEVQIPKYSPFKKSRLEPSHSNLTPKLKSPSKHPGRSKPPAAIASSPRRSTPQPMRGSPGRGRGPPPGSMKLKAPSTPRSGRIAQTKGRGTPKRLAMASPGSFAKSFLPGQRIKVPKTPTEKEGEGSGVMESITTTSLFNTPPQSPFRDASLPLQPPSAFHDPVQYTIGSQLPPHALNSYPSSKEYPHRSFPPFSAIAAEDAHDPEPTAIIVRPKDRPWFENNREIIGAESSTIVSVNGGGNSRGMAQVAAALNTLFSISPPPVPPSLPLVASSHPPPVPSSAPTAIVRDALTRSTQQRQQRQQRQQQPHSESLLPSATLTEVREKADAMISSQARTLNFLFQGYEREKDKRQGGEDEEAAGGTAGAKEEAG